MKKFSIVVYGAFIVGFPCLVFILLLSNKQQSSDIRSKAAQSKTSIVFVRKGSVTPEGSTSAYTWELYRNQQFTCAKSGYQTLLFVYPSNTSIAQQAPLLVRFHGGGGGYYQPDGSYVSEENESKTVEESEESLLHYIKDETGLMKTIREQIPSIRFLLPSMCDHDYYSGDGRQPDPHNPNNPDENGETRTADGLVSTRRAIEYIVGKYNIGRMYFYGTSAGAYGAFNVAANIQKNSNLRVHALVMDSAVGDWKTWQIMNDSSRLNGPRCSVIQENVRDRLGVYGKMQNSSPDLLSSGLQDHWWNTPIFLTWSKKDKYGCGNIEPFKYVDPADGVQKEVSRGTELLYRRFASVIRDKNPGGISEIAELCVTGQRGEECGQHVPTQFHYTNTNGTRDTQDYISYITNWLVRIHKGN